MPTEIVTLFPIMPVVSEWYTYTASGVSIQYPANWQVHQINTPEFASFSLDEAVNVSPFYWINLEIYTRDEEDLKTADPHSWQPNEGGYEIQWEQPLLIDNIPGIEFVWGAHRDNGWDSLPMLMGMLYSQPDRLDIRLTAGFDSPTIDLAMAEGFPKIIKEKFTVFEYMLQSIRIDR